MSLKVRWIVIGLSLVTAQLGIEGCATLSDSESPSKSDASLTSGIEAPSAYPHPVGFAFSDLQSLFQRTGAPNQKDLSTCDQQFQERLIQTPAIDEHIKFLKEDVHKDPEHFHWCFYSKILQLEEDVKAAKFIDEKQKAILRAYAFLTPLAQAMLKERGDPRYLQWAIERYRKLSEVVFYRSVIVAPKTALEIEAALRPKPHDAGDEGAQASLAKDPALSGEKAGSDPESSLDELTTNEPAKSQARNPASSVLDTVPVEASKKSAEDELPADLEIK